MRRLVTNGSLRVRRWAVFVRGLLPAMLVACACGATAHAADRTLTYFPVGPIYEYRWKVLELALDHVRRAEGVAIDLRPFDERVTQNRGVSLLQSGKIDMSFVRDLETNPGNVSIVTAIVALGHSLDLEIVAEGVETPEQLAHLRRLGCDLVQGYLIGRPVPATRALDLRVGPGHPLAGLLSP